MRHLLFLIFVIGCVSACNTVPLFPEDDPHQGLMAFPLTSEGIFAYQDESIAEDEEEAIEEEEEERRSFLVSLLLYLPNRIIDIFDFVRAGVSVGPGIGIDLTATEYLNLSLMTRASVGLGYQTLRHLPIEAASYAMIGVGPLKMSGDPGLSWHRSPGDIRVELHVLLVGAHVAVEPFEIFDFIVGLIGFDPMDDDF